MPPLFLDKRGGVRKAPLRKAILRCTYTSYTWYYCSTRLYHNAFAHTNMRYLLVYTACCTRDATCNVLFYYYVGPGCARQGVSTQFSAQIMFFERFLYRSKRRANTMSSQPVLAPPLSTLLVPRENLIKNQSRINQESTKNQSRINQEVVTKEKKRKN